MIKKEYNKLLHHHIINSSFSVDIWYVFTIQFFIQNILHNKYKFVSLQGSVLSAFFWGYTMTQFLGGYLSDRVGGDVVIPIAACCWSLITFWTPQLVYLSTDKYLTLRIIIFSRVLLGVFQGKSIHLSVCLSLFYQRHFIL